MLIEAPESQLFAEAVRDGLSRSPKQLAPKFFYDALGSQLFEAICRLPWYPITRCETDQLLRIAPAVARALPGPWRLVELGPGDGAKIEILARAFCEAQGRTEVELVDISPEALRAAQQRLAAVPGLLTSVRVADYVSGVASAAFSETRTMVFFLGSNLGNFTPAEAVAFLRGIHAKLRAGDALFLGADLVKPVRDLELAYDDPLGITAAFNKNLLVRMNRELGAGFDLAAFMHVARWNADENRMEISLRSMARQQVGIPLASLTVEFASGEEILTEYSHKFTPAAWVNLVARSGFRLAAQWRHDEGFLNALFIRD